MKRNVLVTVYVSVEADFSDDPEYRDWPAFKEAADLIRSLIGAKARVLSTELAGDDPLCPPRSVIGHVCMAYRERGLV